MLTDSAVVFRQSSFASRIVTEVEQEMRLHKELTRRACVNCAFFSGNEYPICSLHPESLALTAWGINDCKDWKLINRVG